MILIRKSHQIMNNQTNFEFNESLAESLIKEKVIEHTFYVRMSQAFQKLNQWTRAGNPIMTCLMKCIDVNLVKEHKIDILYSFLQNEINCKTFNLSIEEFIEIMKIYVREENSEIVRILLNI